MLRTPASRPGLRVPKPDRRPGAPCPEFGRPHRWNLHLFCYICRTWKAFRTNQETNFRFAARLSLYLPYETSDNHNDTARRDALRRSAGSDPADARRQDARHGRRRHDDPVWVARHIQQLRDGHFLADAVADILVLLRAGAVRLLRRDGILPFRQRQSGADRLAAVPARHGRIRWKTSGAIRRCVRAPSWAIWAAI